MTDESPSQFRFGVAYACSWRVVAALFREHQAALGLRVEHAHGGLSPDGAIRVVRPGDRPTVVSLDLASGMCHTTVWDADGDAVTCPPASDLLRLPIERVVDPILEATGWGHRAQIAPTNRPTLAARAIARFLETRALSRTEFRTTCGYIDNPDSAGLCPWVATFPGAAERLRGPSPESFAMRFRLVHRVSDGLARVWRQGPERPPSAIVDVATARAVRLSAPERVEDLFAMYTESGQDLRPVVRWIEAATDAR